MFHVASLYTRKNDNERGNRRSIVVVDDVTKNTINRSSSTLFVTPSIVMLWSMCKCQWTEIMRCAWLNQPDKCPIWHSLTKRKIDLLTTKVNQSNAMCGPQTKVPQSEQGRLIVWWIRSLKKQLHEFTGINTHEFIVTPNIRQMVVHITKDNISLPWIMHTIKTLHLKLFTEF